MTAEKTEKTSKEIDEVDETTQRERKMTEKGLEEQKRQMKNKQTTSLANVTKIRNEIDSWMRDEENVHIVKRALTKLTESFQIYKDCYTAHTAILTAEEQKDEETRYNGKELSFIECRKGIVNWIKEAEGRLSDKLDGTTVRSTSITSSTRSSLIREKAKIAALLAEKKMQQKKQEKERQIQQLQQEKERQAQQLKQESEDIELEIKIAKAEAMSGVYEAMNDQLNETVTEVEESMQEVCNLDLTPPLKSPTPFKQVNS